MKQKWLWNDGPACDFPRQKTLIEVAFRTEGLLSVLSGEVRDSYLIENPIPKFRYCREKRKTGRSSIAGSKSVDVILDQPFLDTKCSAPSEEWITVGFPEYLELLGSFQSSFEDWKKRRKIHDDLVHRALLVFHDVFGPETLRSTHEVRHNQGIAAAWKIITSRYTVPDASIESVPNAAGKSNVDRMQRQRADRTFQRTKMKLIEQTARLVRELTALSSAPGRSSGSRPWTRPTMQAVSPPTLAPAPPHPVQEARYEQTARIVRELTAPCTATPRSSESRT